MPTALFSSKNKKAPEPCGSRAKLGGGSSPRSLPSRTHWALSLSRAVCSPTPLFAACEGFGLMAGPFRPLPVEIYRVRPLRPVRPPLASGGHARRGADTPATCVARVGTVTTGSAPAFGRALALCYGSDLLTLRLHFALQLGDVVFHAAPRKEVFEPCLARSLPEASCPLRAPPITGRAFLARWSRQNTLPRADLHSSNHIPLGKLRGRTDRNSPFASLGSSTVSNHASPHSS